MATFLEVLFLLFVVVVLLLIAIWTIICGISPMPTVGKTKKALLEALPDTIDGCIVDLGSGWGTLAFALSQKYPHNTVIGYELSPIPYIFSKILCINRKHVHFERRDFFTSNLQNAGLIVCYLYPDAMRRLEEKLSHELEKNTLIVSHTFAFPTFHIEKVIEVADLYKTKIYFFIKAPSTRGGD